MEEKTYPIYIVNIAKKDYEMIECDSIEERRAVEQVIGTVSWLFDENIGDKICVKYVKPEFEEVE